MKLKLLSDAGEIGEGTAVEVQSRAGMNDVRTDEDVGGQSATPAPVYAVTDTEGHAEKVDTRDLQVLPKSTPPVGKAGERAKRRRPSHRADAGR